MQAQAGRALAHTQDSLPRSRQRGPHSVCAAWAWVRSQRPGQGETGPVLGAGTRARGARECWRRVRRFSLPVDEGLPQRLQDETAAQLALARPEDFHYNT